MRTASFLVSLAALLGSALIAGYMLGRHRPLTAIEVESHITRVHRGPEPNVVCISTRGDVAGDEGYDCWGIWEAFESDSR